MAGTQNMAMVLQALKTAGLNDNQARILGAEIGRENAFQDKYLWGYHTDPKNGAVNIGIISWQGARGKGVERALKSAGLIQNGKIVKGQASLNVMAKYLVDEIKNNTSFAKTKKQFLDNPNVDYGTGARVLGTNFIRWRYNDPKFAGGHKNRDNYYRQLGGIMPTDGVAMMASNARNIRDNYVELIPSTTGTSGQVQALPQPIAQPLPTYPQAHAVDLFSGVRGLMGLNLDLFSALQRAGTPQAVQPVQTAQPLMPSPFF